MASNYDDSIARIDAARLRKIGNLMVHGAKYDDSPKVLDLSKQNPRELLENYSQRMKAFDTAPFDPNGISLRFYEGGYTVWSGYPGTGKTTLLRQLVCHLLHREKGVFAAVLEDDPGDTLIRTAGVAFGTDLPTVTQMEWFIDYYAHLLRVWGVIGLAGHREIFGCIQEQAAKGIKHFLIDSLMCLDVPSDDFEAQRKFANALSALCRTLRIHVHLVAHPRKVIGSDQEPDLNDVAGSADIGRLADNVFFIRRGPAGNLEGVTAMQILIKKQRHDPAYLGNITGWFNRRLRQFKIDQFDQVPTQYLPKVAYGDQA